MALPLGASGLALCAVEARPLVAAVEMTGSVKSGDSNPHNCLPPALSPHSTVIFCSSLSILP